MEHRVLRAALRRDALREQMAQAPVAVRHREGLLDDPPVGGGRDLEIAAGRRLMRSFGSGSSTLP